MLVGLGGIVAALLYVNRAPAVPTASGAAGATAAPPAVSRASTPAAAKPTVTRATLAQNDGQAGHKCYVAVDGNVYLIENLPLWAGGRHIPSNGRATCGQDLTTVIDQSPHGRSKLLLLTEVGRLEG
jgi:predicted heme/steroid binding protein